MNATGVWKTLSDSQVEQIREAAWNHIERHGFVVQHEGLLTLARARGAVVDEAGGRVRLHICGNITGHLPKIAELGVDMIDVDFLTDMTGIRQKLGPGPAILGNLDPVKCFVNSPPQDVKTGLAECHRQCVSKFLVGAGCEIPPGAKPDNVRAMAEYAREAV